MALQISLMVKLGNYITQESIGNERWNQALLSWSRGREPCVPLGQALNIVVPNTHIPGRCFIRWGGPGADAEWDTQEVSGYNYTVIKMNAGLSPLLYLSYGS